MKCLQNKFEIQVIKCNCKYKHPLFLHLKALFFLNISIFWLKSAIFFVLLKVLGLRLGVDFTFTLDNNDNNNDNDNNDNDNNNPHLNFLKGTVLGGKVQGLGIRDKR